MGKFSVAFIGCGNRGRAHAVGVRADGRCEVVAVTDVNADAAAKMNADYGFAGRVYADHRRMLAEVRPDVVVSSLWTPLHLPVFRDCVEAGVRAVMCEKPMAPTWGDCLEMARLAEQRGCQLTFCHQRRFATGNRRLRQLIADGRFGAVERMDLYSPPNLLDCGTHTIDQAMSFNAESPARWVLGAVDASAPLEWFDVKAETMAVATIVFANGVRAHLQTGGPDADLWGGVRLTGSGGFFEVFWDGKVKRAVAYDDPAWRMPPEVAETDDDHMRAAVRDAIDALEAGRPPEMSYPKALRVSEAIFAIYESVRRHARVELPLTGVRDNPFTAMLEAGRFAETA